VKRARQPTAQRDESTEPVENDEIWTMARRPPNQRDRWMATHPVLGALALGSCWGALVALWGAFTTHDALVVAALLVGGVCAFGPLIVWATRRSVLRWDAEHSTS
jgi:hypothetical protein